MCQSGLSIVAMYFSAMWLWQGRHRRAFIMGCLNLLPASFWILMERPGSFELRSGYYVWLAGVTLWAVGVGCIRVVDRRRPASSSKETSPLEEL
ncbi:hypothetical protein [Paludisphaera borealis]|nr:hypothetical protein [Paludisphaera borealis]